MEYWSVDLRFRFSPRRRIVPLRAGGQLIGLTGRLPAHRAYSLEIGLIEISSYCVV